MAELVDALISGVSGETRADSNSVVRTIEERLNKPFFCYILRKSTDEHNRLQCFLL